MPISNFQRPIDASIKYQGGDPQTPLLVTAADTLDPNERFIYVTPPASSSYIITLPQHGSVEDGAEFLFYCTSTAGGEVRIDTPAGADAVGDNLSAVGDYVIIKKIGTVYSVLKEVTT